MICINVFASILGAQSSAAKRTPPCKSSPEDVEVRIIDQVRGKGNRRGAFDIQRSNPRISFKKRTVSIFFSYQFLTYIVYWILFSSDHIIVLVGKFLLFICLSICFCKGILRRKFKQLKTFASKGFSFYWMKEKRYSQEKTKFGERRSKEKQQRSLSKCNTAVLQEKSQ